MLRYNIPKKLALKEEKVLFCWRRLMNSVIFEGNYDPSNNCTTGQQGYAIL